MFPVSKTKGICACALFNVLVSLVILFEGRREKGEKEKERKGRRRGKGEGGGKDTAR